jgi:hypothetical protein
MTHVVLQQMMQGLPTIKTENSRVSTVKTLLWPTKDSKVTYAGMGFKRRSGVP